MAELFTLVGKIAIETEDAEAKINAVIEAGAGLEAKLNGLGANADSYIGSKSGFGAASVWLGNMLTELTHRAAQLGKEFILSGLKYNAAMEGYEVSFGTLLNGDMEKAKQLMKEITDFALNSPLNVSGVSAAALQLLNIGTDYEDVIPMLKMLGDLSLGDARKMDMLAVALSQVMGFGQLYGQEKQQFVNAGVPIYTLLEDYYKIVEGMDAAGLDLDGMQRAGKIRSEHVLGALQLATMSDEEVFEKYGYSGEREVSFYNAMAAMLPTYIGQTQKASEQTEIASGALVAPYQEELTNSVLPAYTEFAAAFAEKYSNEQSQKDNAAFLSNIATNMLNALTDAASGKYDITAENAENLTPLGKLLTGAYGWQEFLNEMQRKEADQDTDDRGGGMRFGDEDDAGPLEHTRDTVFRRNGLPDGVDVDGTGGSMGLVGTLAAIQGTLASLPAEVQSAASAGVAEGVGGITVTGSITTGDVTLDTGVVVGQLIPHLDLKLGAANARAGRGA